MNKIKHRKIILVIAAHADDLEFSCGGTVAKFAEEGHKIFSLVITDGSKGSHILKMGPAKLAKIRKKEAENSASILGIKNVLFLKMKDGEIENTRALRKELVKTIREVKPDVILSFDPSNLKFDNPFRFHRDHRMAAEAVFDAVYPAAGNSSFFPELPKSKYPPHQVKEIWFFGTEKPNKFIDIGLTINTKVRSLFQYLSQVDPKAVEKRIRLFARRFSKKKNGYIEAFRIIKFKK